MATLSANSRRNSQASSNSNSPRPSISSAFHPFSTLTQQMSSVNEEDGEATDESRPASRKPSAAVLQSQRLSVANRGDFQQQQQSCTIRHMKVKERSCSERSDSGFSECANHSTGTCTCEKKRDTAVVKDEQDPAAVPTNGIEVSKPGKILNPRLLKNKLERIASLQFDEEENILVELPQLKQQPESKKLETSSSSTTTLPTSEDKAVNLVAPIAATKTTRQSNADAAVATEVSPPPPRPLVDPISSDLDYDIKRFNLDGSCSVRSRKKSLENQAKKDLTLPLPLPASLATPSTIRLSNRVSDLKSRFDSGPILPTKIGHSQANVSTLKITLNPQWGSNEKGNKACLTGWLGVSLLWLVLLIFDQIK